MTYTPTVRKPTGIPAAPLILVSGFAKSGKSLTTYRLALSKRIRNCRVMDLGEGSADEYGGDPEDPPYEVLDWGSSWSDLQDSIRWCVRESTSCADGEMDAVIIDSGTELWDGLKSRADKRARGSAKNVKALKEDPDFEVDVSMPYWNDAKETWARCITPLKLAPKLVGVVIARSEMVAEVVNGVPTKNKVVSYQVEKTLQGIATAHIAVDMDHKATLLEVRSKHVSVPSKGMRLTSDNPLDEVIELLSPSGKFASPDARRPVDDGRDDPEITEFMALLAAHRSDDVGDQLRAFAKRYDKTIGASHFAADPDWFADARQLVRDLLTEGETQ